MKLEPKVESLPYLRGEGCAARLFEQLKGEFKWPVVDVYFRIRKRIKNALGA